MNVPEGDRTRRQDAAATRRVDPPSPDATRRVERADVDPGADRTQQLDPTSAPPSRTRAMEATVDPRTGDRVTVDDPAYDETYGGGHDDRTPDGRGADGPDDAPPKRRGRDWAIGLLGAVLGVLLAVVVVALGTDAGEPDGGGDPASAEQVVALEAERDELQAAVADAEARAADAEAAAGEGDADIAAQREALDERATALDERASALDQREGALDEREAALGDREAAVEQAEADAAADADTPAPEGDGTTEPTDDGADEPGGLEIPDIDIGVDGEEVDGFIDRILNGVRDLL